MGTCDNCIYAEWKRTTNGRLHPDKSGRCEWFKNNPLRIPSAFYWVGAPPLPGGGYIERESVLKNECVLKTEKPND